MKFKNQLIILILLSFINKSTTQPKKDVDFPDLTCGKEKPKKDTDCTRYGTDSGMLCCFVEFQGDKNCYLIFGEKAKKEFDIIGEKEFDDGSKWSCGNISVYLSINMFIILISIFLY